MSWAVRPGEATLPLAGLLGWLAVGLGFWLAGLSQLAWFCPARPVLAGWTVARRAGTVGAAGRARAGTLRRLGDGLEVDAGFC